MQRSFIKDLAITLAIYHLNASLFILVAELVKSIFSYLPLANFAESSSFKYLMFIVSIFQAYLIHRTKQEVTIKSALIDATFILIITSSVIVFAHAR